jgi:predicted ATPase/class 3 adenylate cyclase
MEANRTMTEKRYKAEPAPRTLTFVFTDLEGSTQLWERFPDAMKPALARHDAILRAAVEGQNGQVVKSTGDGLMAIFSSVTAAVSACVTAQRKLLQEPWGETGPLRVRMALHAGEAEARVGDYFGPTVNRAARIMAVGHGGQVLLSAAAAALVIDQLPDAATLRDLGEHRLKDLGRPEHIYQLVHPDLVQEFPPLTTLNTRPNNLPTSASTFVGREAELVEIRRRLEDENVRLLTLTGPGGTGKTRLALRVAAGMIDRFPDGVFFVDLSPVRDTESVLARIAGVIGVDESRSQSLLADLKSQLRDQRMLLVLDNFEQVAAAAATAADLLLDCSALKLLVTSREALHVRGEHLYLVPPLSLPEATREPRSAAELARYEAVQLFVDRAQEVQANFQLTDKNANAVAEICRRLDGLPLAIELVTARIRLFSPEALRDRLSRRLDLLRSGARDLPARQQTLRATIEWSYSLLESGEQRLLELLSVFSGIGLEAVEAVAGDVAALTGEGIDTLDGLASLLDKSLLRQADTGDDAPRLLMLETIREYVAERLDDRPDFSAAVRRAHGEYFADFAQRRREDLTGEQREPALAAITADIDNLRLAWQYWVAEHDQDRLNKMLHSLWLFYDARGWYHATIQLATDLLDMLSSSPDSPERAMQEITLRTGLARALMAVKGYTPEVEWAYTQAVQLLQGREPPQLFPALRSLASLYNFRGQFDKGSQIGREIIRLAEQQNDRSMLVDGYLVLGANSAFLNDLNAGLEHLDRAIAFFRSEALQPRPYRLGNHPGVACFTTSGLILWLLGYPDRALQRAAEGLTLATKLEHPYTLAYAHFHNGVLHLWRREPEHVRNRAVAVLRVVEDNDFQIWRALGTFLLGAGNVGIGRSGEGLAQIQQGMDLYRGLAAPPVFWPLLLSIQAGAHAEAGKVAEGLALINEALDTAGRGQQGVLLPELNLLKGDLGAALPEAERTDPEPSYRLAFNMAQRMDARMPQLRAAIRLCRISRDPDMADQSRRTLRAIYATFTEGFTTADLVEAATLLAERRSPSA